MTPNPIGAMVRDVLGEFNSHTLKDGFEQTGHNSKSLSDPKYPNRPCHNLDR